MRSQSGSAVCLQRCRGQDSHLAMLARLHHVAKGREWRSLPWWMVQDREANHDGHWSYPIAKWRETSKTMFLPRNLQIDWDKSMRIRKGWHHWDHLFTPQNKKIYTLMLANLQSRAKCCLPHPSQYPAKLYAPLQTSHDWCRTPEHPAMVNVGLVEFQPNRCHDL